MIPTCSIRYNRELLAARPSILSALHTGDFNPRVQDVDSRQLGFFFSSPTHTADSRSAAHAARARSIPSRHPCGSRAERLVADQLLYTGQRETDGVQRPAMISHLPAAPSASGLGFEDPCGPALRALLSDRPPDLSGLYRPKRAARPAP